MDWELRPILDLQIHFSPSQLLRDSEITLFAIRNARIIQACSSVEGVWPQFCAPGKMQNISAATLPPKSLCRQEVRLLTLSKMPFSSGLFPVPVATRCHRYRAGSSRRRPGSACRGSCLAAAEVRRYGAKHVLCHCCCHCQSDSAKVQKNPYQGWNILGLASNADAKYHSIEPFLAFSLPFHAVMLVKSLVFVFKALAVFSLQTKLHCPKLFVSLLEY